MRYQFCLVLILAAFCYTSSSYAENDYSVSIDPVTKDRFLTFKSDKGNVRFNHDLHQAEMKAESCFPCHKTKTPTKAHTMTRFDQRVAHYFCKGCHRELNRGPVECHECHKGHK
ncbi:MAG: cytochrome c3 family protein [Desulfuromonadaceae bacterium]|nr:cytochrome c3 family protein [Desulfuromonadaceae bacterium]